MKIKASPTVHCLQDTHFRYKDINRLKVKEWKNIYHAASNYKKTGAAILIPDNIDFYSRDTVEMKKLSKL